MKKCVKEVLLRIEYHGQVWYEIITVVSYSPIILEKSHAKTFSERGDVYPSIQRPS